MIFLQQFSYIQGAEEKSIEFSIANQQYLKSRQKDHGFPIPNQLYPRHRRKYHEFPIAYFLYKKRESLLIALEKVK